MAFGLVDVIRLGLFCIQLIWFFTRPIHKPVNKAVSFMMYTAIIFLMAIWFLAVIDLALDSGATFHATPLNIRHAIGALTVAVALYHIYVIHRILLSQAVQQEANQGMVTAKTDRINFEEMGANDASSVSRSSTESTRTVIYVGAKRALDTERAAPSQDAHIEGSDEAEQPQEPKDRVEKE